MDLKQHIPSYIDIEGNRALISYDTQPATCCGCHQTGHIYQYCPRRSRAPNKSATMDTVTWADIAAHRRETFQTDQVHIPTSETTTELADHYNIHRGLPPPVGQTDGDDKVPGQLDKGEHAPSERGQCFEFPESGTNGSQADRGERADGPPTVVAEEKSRPETKTPLRHTARNKTNPAESCEASMMLRVQEGVIQTRD
jgi:hypothetical protein